MPTTTVKNIAGELYERLKQSARDNRRSINSKIIVCIARTLRGWRADSEMRVTQEPQVREQAIAYVIDEEKGDTTPRGRITGQLIPAHDTPAVQDLAAVWASLDQLAAEIGARWPAHLSAGDAVSEQRREL